MAVLPGYDGKMGMKAGLKRRFYFLIITIVLVVVAGSFGYFLLFGGRYKFIDCLYMTVISLTSVGYGEVIPISGNVSAQIFTIILITAGLGVILYGISALAALFIEGELTGFLRDNKMKKQIKKLKKHYIVCGGGHTGYPLLTELVKNGETAVLIELEEEKIKGCREIEGIFVIQGDATDDCTLMDAGIENAQGILITLPSDKDSLYVTMSARMLNKDIRIISRVVKPGLETKMLKAGADRAVSPNAIGALRMASEMIRPVAVDFLDKMLRTGDNDLRIHQITITGKSGINGKSIGESGLKDRFGLLVLGTEDGQGGLSFNPSSETLLKQGMTLIVMGEVSNIMAARDYV